MRRVLIAIVFAGAAQIASAQGCSQCRDTVSQTNPAQQQSYRVAIGIMLAGALTVGGAGVLVVRRFGR
ncbi:copper resistance protein CopC [Terriglobus sp.]|uniref:copper resistance protein CopC n=1 Tax=Terriglobus sp. TaxID=1889013 RepID=UPI003B001769